LEKFLSGLRNFSAGREGLPVRRKVSRATGKALPPAEKFAESLRRFHGGPRSFSAGRETLQPAGKVFQSAGKVSARPGKSLSTGDKPP
jgi:hypothetical protein